MGTKIQAQYESFHKSLLCFEDQAVWNWFYQFAVTNPTEKIMDQTEWSWRYRLLPTFDQSSLSVLIITADAWRLVVEC